MQNKQGRYLPSFVRYDNKYEGTFGLYGLLDPMEHPSKFSSMVRRYTFEGTKVRTKVLYKVWYSS